MSIDSLTVDDFLRLDFEEHREALAQYDERLGQVAQQVTQAAPGSEPHLQGLDKLCRLASLRKVHRVRLAELEEDEAVPTAERYPFAELDQLPS